MSKYGRTYHFTFSPEIHSDDKTLPKTIENNFINNRIIITEKLDGSNACMRLDKVYGRSHEIETTHPSFNMLKQINRYLFINDLLDPNEFVFGENMEAIHSIVYENISSPFYVFGIRKNNIWYSWEETRKRANELNLPTVPEIFDGVFTSLQRLKEFLDNEIKKESCLGGDREGFVVRLYETFHENDFHENIAKYVRKNHVKSSEHWTNNWKKANISYDFRERFYYK